MKKILLMALCLCVIWSGCAGPDPSPAVAPSVSTQTENLQTKADDGTLLLERSYPRFSLTLPDTKAAQVIETDLQGRIDTWMASAADLESYALEEYSAEKGWTMWFGRLEGQSTRLDNQVFSLYFEYSEFTGGNHPNVAIYSVTYDCQSGQVLELNDLLVPGCDTPLASLVNDLLADRAQELYDDYEALVGKAFADGTVKWYLSHKGLCFHFAPYHIGPYASGTITATIPYGQLSDILQSQYLSV